MSEKQEADKTPNEKETGTPGKRNACESATWDQLQGNN